MVSPLVGLAAADGTQQRTPGERGASIASAESAYKETFTNR